MIIRTHLGQLTITDSDVRTSPIAPARPGEAPEGYTHAISLGVNRRLFLTADEAEHIRLERETLGEEQSPRFQPFAETEDDTRARFAFVALLSAQGHVGRAAAALRQAGVLDAPTDAAARRALDRLIADRGWRDWLSGTYPQPGRASG